MDSLPSANMRQHKLDQQRRLIEEKQRQKRAQQNKKIGQCSWGPVVRLSIIRLSPEYSVNTQSAGKRQIISLKP